MIKRFIVSLLLFVCATQSLWGQLLLFKNIGVNRGLSNNDVLNIAEDEMGYMWFATEEGLTRFDGSRCVNFYRDQQVNAISGNELNKILYDPSRDKLWIATQYHGLSVYDNATREFRLYNDTVESLPVSVTALTLSSDNKLWVGSYHNGVMLLDPDSDQVQLFSQSTLPGLVSNSVISLYDDGSGSIYIGHSNSGLSILSLSTYKVEHYDTSNSSILGDVVNSIYADSKGRIWIGTDKGASIFNPHVGSFTPVSLVNLECEVYDFKESSDGDMWIATGLYGVFVLQMHDVSNYYIKQQYQYSDGVGQLSALGVRAMHQDQYGNFWVATYGGGVDFIQKTPPLFWQMNYSNRPEDKESLTSRFAWGLAMDSQGRLWVGTDGDGINIFDNGKRVAEYSVSNSALESNNILSLHCDKRGRMWIGTYNQGLYLYEPSSGKIRKFPIDGISDVRDFFEDDKGQLWLVGWDILASIDLANLSVERCESQYLSNRVMRSVIIDSKDRIWIGLYGGGLLLLDSNINLLHRFSTDKELQSNMINSLLEDAQGRIIAGTGDGLVIIEEGDEDWSWQVVDKRSGLVNSHIKAIAVDTQSNIWVSTNKGVSMVASDGKLVRNFGAIDNVPISSFKSNSVLKDRDGAIYFGSQDGISIFNPERVLNAKDAVDIAITDFLTHSLGDVSHIAHNISGDKLVRLQHNDNNFTINFNPKDYSMHNRVEFRYRLDGYSSLWYKTTENKATFFNVEPGRYTFELQYRVANGQWSEESVMLPITINYPLLSSPLAVIIYFIIVIAFVVAMLNVYRTNLQNKHDLQIERETNRLDKELNKERLKFYTNITHELRTPLTLIVGPLEDLKRDTTLTNDHLRKVNYIAKSAERLLKLINQILDFRKTETENRELFIKRGSISDAVFEIASKYQSVANVNNNVVNVDIQPDITAYFDEEVLTVILDNLISNAIKYTNDGDVTIVLNECCDNGVDYITLSVADTGIGIDPESISLIFDRYYQADNRDQSSTVGTGIGLSLVKSLVDMHEGYIKVTSHLGVGSIFTVSLVKNNTYPMERHQQSVLSDNKFVEEYEVKPILLIVEDDFAIRQYIAEAFSERYTILEAKNGVEGIALAEEHIPDIIISDVMMPELSGTKLCAKLKGDIRTSHIPIVLLTAKDSLADKEMGYKVGADSYITKPFSASLLSSRINNLMESRKALAATFIQHTDIESRGDGSLEGVDFVEKEFIELLTQHIEENLTSNRLDVAFLADKMCMSNSSLYRKVKALTGITTNEYIRKVKLSRSKVLLSENRHSIVDVAFMVGFSNAIYFRQCFKDEYGVTPSRYIRSQQEAKQNIIQSSIASSQGEDANANS